RPFEIGALLQNESVRGAAIEPDIDDVFDLLVILGIAPGSEEFGWIARIPGVGAILLEGISDTIDYRLIAQCLAAALLDEHRDRHTPGALARDAPVRPRLDHGADTVLALRRKPFRCVDGGKRLLAQIVVLHADKPLRRGAKDQRRLGAPGMRI